MLWPNYSDQFEAAALKTHCVMHATVRCCQNRTSLTDGLSIHVAMTTSRALPHVAHLHGPAKLCGMTPLSFRVCDGVKWLGENACVKNCMPAHVGVLLACMAHLPGLSRM